MWHLRGLGRRGGGGERGARQRARGRGRHVLRGVRVVRRRGAHLRHGPDGRQRRLAAAPARRHALLGYTYVVHTKYINIRDQGRAAQASAMRLPEVILSKVCIRYSSNNSNVVHDIIIFLILPYFMYINDIFFYQNYYNEFITNKYLYVA